MMKDIALSTKELKRVQFSSPYHFLEIIQGEKRARMTREEVRNLFIAHTDKIQILIPTPQDPRANRVHRVLAMEWIS